MSFYPASGGKEVNIPNCYETSGSITSGGDRQTAVKAICADFLANYPNDESKEYSIKYSGNKYAIYNISRVLYSSNYPYLTIKEYMAVPSDSGYKFGFWMYNVSSGSGALNWSIANS